MCRLPWVVYFDNIFSSSPRTWYMFSSVSVLVPLSASYTFSDYRSFASLGRFICRYFILFDAMVNEIVSLTF